MKIGDDVTLSGKIVDIYKLTPVEVELAPGVYENRCDYKTLTPEEMTNVDPSEDGYFLHILLTACDEDMFVPAKSVKTLRPV